MIPNPGHYNPLTRFPVSFFVIVVAVIVGEGGCSVFSPVGEFIGQRYENTVAYFNTYYNASTAFDEAETEVLQQQEILRSKDQPIKLGDISSTAKQKFDLSIEKFSRLLSFYPTSKWVDESLFMIGKAYYYKGDLVRGERKFRELITTKPSSDYVNSALLWLARSLVAGNHFEKAREELTPLIPRAYENKEREVGAEAGLLLGQVCLNLADTSAALTAFQSVIDQSRNGARSAEAQLSIAELISVTGEPDEVLKSFAKVRNYDPDVVTDYKARLRFAQYLTKIGRYDESMTELQYLLDRPAYLEYHAQIKYSLANAYNRKGDINEAYTRYVEVDTLFARTDVAAQSYFERALIQQKDSGNYSAAMTLFEKARTENPQSPFSVKAATYADAMKQYVQLRSRIARCDTLLGRYAQKIDSTRKNAILADSIKGITAVPKISESKKTIDDTLGAKMKNQKDADIVMTKDTVKAHSPGHAAKDSVIARKDTLKTTKAVVVDTVKVLSDRIVALYDLGSLLYLQIGEPDSALYIFREVLRDAPPADIAAGSLYTMGQIYLATMREHSSSADSLFDTILVRYPASRYAQEIRRQRGMPLLDISDEEDARKLFIEAENTLTASDSEKTFRMFKKVIDKHPQSEHAVKAHYTIGWLYENKYLNPDSAAAWYTIVSRNFSQSHYAEKIKGKLAEVEAIRKKLDSVATADAQSRIKAPPSQLPGAASGPRDTTRTAVRDTTRMVGKDTTRTAMKDTTTHHPVIGSVADTTHNAAIDSLSKTNRRPLHFDEELHDRRGRRNAPLDSLTKPGGNIVSQDTSKTLLPDSLSKKNPGNVKKEKTVPPSQEHPGIPDSTGH